MTTDNTRIYKDDDFLNYKEAGLVLGFDEETAENGVKRLMREHNLPYTEFSPNNIKFQYGDLKEYIKSKKVNVLKDNTKETLSHDKDQLEIEKSKTEAIIAENNLKIKLAELNINSINEIQTMRDTLLTERQALSIERAKATSELSLLNELKSNYTILLTTINDVIKHQEQVTNGANDKLSQANTKMDNYTILQEKKYNECLRRDKSKCEKCNHKIFSELHKKDFEKWSKKHLTH